jgi:hypothetical protein
MTSWIFFRRESGEAVHTHIEPDEVGTDADELWELIDPSHKRDDLDVVVADSQPPGEAESRRVHPQTRRLESAEGVSFGGGGGGSAAGSQSPKGARRVANGRPTEP